MTLFEFKIEFQIRSTSMTQYYLRLPDGSTRPLPSETLLQQAWMAVWQAEPGTELLEKQFVPRNEEMLGVAPPPARRAEPGTMDGHDLRRPGLSGIEDGNHDPTGGFSGA